MGLPMIFTQLVAARHAYSTAATSSVEPVKVEIVNDGFVWPDADAKLSFLSREAALMQCQ
jgi:hypothetical protein